MQHLQPNTTLQGGKYRIEKMLGQGGFGITYLAVQIGLDRKVAVKEFFMKELCERNESTSHVTLGTQGSKETVNRFREKFLKEARNIAKLNHPNIVRVIDIFEENGTAYYVMEYAENGSLADKVKREGYLSEPIATRYIKQVAEALNYIHARNMNHLDIKPGNIMLNEEDNAILIDFGLSKQYDATTGSQTSTTPVGISHGYAPMEQYKEGGVGEFSPETDIYALGATFFKLLTGITPPSASDVYEDGVPVNELQKRGVSKVAIDLICNAMKGRKKDRIASMAAFANNLEEHKPTNSTQNRPINNEATIAVAEEELTVSATQQEAKSQSATASEEKKESVPYPLPLFDRLQEKLRNRNTQILIIFFCLIAVMYHYFRETVWMGGGLGETSYTIQEIVNDFVPVVVLTLLFSSFRIKSVYLWIVLIVCCACAIFQNCWFLCVYYYPQYVETFRNESGQYPISQYTLLLYSLTTFYAGISIFMKTKTRLLRVGIILFLGKAIIYIIVFVTPIDFEVLRLLLGIYLCSFFIFIYCACRNIITQGNTTETYDVFYRKGLIGVLTIALIYIAIIVAISNGVIEFLYSEPEIIEEDTTTGASLLTDSIVVDTLVAD